MHHDLSPSASSKGLARHMHWFALCAAAAVIAAAGWLAGADGKAPSVSMAGVLGFERSHIRQTMAALGYDEVVSLQKHDDGSWQAKAQRDGTYWQVRISPYGSVSAHPAPQLGVLLE